MFKIMQSKKIFYTIVVLLIAAVGLYSAFKIIYKPAAKPITIKGEVVCLPIDGADQSNPCSIGVRDEISNNYYELEDIKGQNLTADEITAGKQIQVSGMLLSKTPSSPKENKNTSINVAGTIKVESYTPSPTATPKPAPITECKVDADCPSSKYVCEAIQSTGTSNTQPPIFTIIKGVCKLKEGNQCSAGSDCLTGLLCHSNVCVNPIGRQCSGPNDTSCPADYQCVQG